MSVAPKKPAAKVDVTPSASRLTKSLRDIGYDFTAALADLIDNSISADARKIDIELVFDGADSFVLIADDGVGMTESQLGEALRFGTRRDYELGDLGRYGLGLKTASISQCRRLTVITRRSEIYRRIAALTLDVDHIGATDRWEVTEPPPVSAAGRSLEWLDHAPGTVVIWERLDRVLPYDDPTGGWARRRISQLAVKAKDYLGMVFHRHLVGRTASGERITITVNGEKVRPWDPFAPDEAARQEVAEQTFEVGVGSTSGRISLRGFVLPPRNAFSSQAEFDRLSGPLKWNRQQGLYIYRADRLIQSGGWCGIRAVDEHTKLARASLDFRTDLDEVFRINVTKMRVILPPEIRTLLERPVGELCHWADAAYRRDPTSRKRTTTRNPRTGSPARTMELGGALLAAALDAGETEALDRIIGHLQNFAPDAASALGWAPDDL